MDWKIGFSLEIQRAVDARARGNEGQARVCARRAAGIVVREYFQRNHMPVHSPSAYALLVELAGMSGLPENVRKAAESLTLRVSAEFTLPAELDLVESARLLAENLLKDRGQG